MPVKVASKDTGTIINALIHNAHNNQRGQRQLFL
jgi:hypothetical protein